MRNTLVDFGNSLQAIPYFAALGNEVVVWIDHEKCGDLFIKLQISTLVSPVRPRRSLCAGHALLRPRQ